MILQNVQFTARPKGWNAWKNVRSSAVICIAVALHPLLASPQSARDVKGPTPLVAIQNEAPAKLIVDAPIPEQLALGRVFIQYRTENLRILPVFGKAALDVSPRVGHCTITWMTNPGRLSIPAARPWSL